jgi:cyclic dehypoxanthinyl futalosine synthase
LTDDWLNVHRVWHELGGRSTATMMFGHIETLAERIEHLERLRQLQDETGGFTAFICWTFQPDHTDMADVPPAGSFDYLKTQAVSRLYLDNVPNIQSSWVTQGLKMGQLALLFGANDMGSLMIEENVVAEAGTVHFLTLDEIRAAIEELGLSPRQRNAFYELLDPKHEMFAVEANRARCDQIRKAQSATTQSATTRLGVEKPIAGGRASAVQPTDGNGITMEAATSGVPLSIVSGDGTA